MAQKERAVLFKNRKAEKKTGKQRKSLTDVKRRPKKILSNIIPLSVVWSKMFGPQFGRAAEIGEACLGQSLPGSFWPTRRNQPFSEQGPFDV